MALRRLISESEIQSRILEIGAQITADYPDGTLYLICILKGAFMFLADLARAIERDAFVDFMGISSYGVEKTSSGEVRITKDLDISLEGADVLIVEDIVDSGVTLSYLTALLETSGRGRCASRLCSISRSGVCAPWMWPMWASVFPTCSSSAMVSISERVPESARCLRLEVLTRSSTGFAPHSTRSSIREAGYRKRHDFSVHTADHGRRMLVSSRVACKRQIATRPGSCPIAPSPSVARRGLGAATLALSTNLSPDPSTRPSRGASTGNVHPKISVSLISGVW